MFGFSIGASVYDDDMLPGSEDPIGDVEIGVILSLYDEDWVMANDISTLFGTSPGARGDNEKRRRVMGIDDFNNWGSSV